MALQFIFIAAIFGSFVKADQVLENQTRSKLISGDLMPLVGLGTSSIKGTEQVRNVLDYALAAGYRLLDTAQIYANEEDIGRALRELLPKHNLSRQDIWITTKYFSGGDAYEALKESLRKLNTNYVDLYLIHWPGEPGTEAGAKNARFRDQTWTQMIKALQEGLAKNIGVSNYNVKHLKELLANDHGTKPVVNQVEWHPFYHPQDLLDFCRQHEILLQAYSSLGGGRDLGLINHPKVQEIAKKLAKSPGQVLLKWAVQQNIGVIPRSKSEIHIKENFDLNFTISEDDMTTLSTLPFHKKYIRDPDSIL